MQNTIEPAVTATFIKQPFLLNCHVRVLLQLFQSRITTIIQPPFTFLGCHSYVLLLYDGHYKLPLQIAKLINN